MRQSVMQSHEFVCDLPRLESALKRLHTEKSSPDGLTAEMLRQLPHDELINMAAAIQEMFRSLSFEASRTVITASLIPKKAVTRTLSDMRPSSVQVAGVSLDGRSLAFAVDGAPSWFRAWSSAC